MASGGRLGALGHGAVPPAALSVEHFAAERAEDAERLLAMAAPTAVRHLRRRARSWRPFGLARGRAKKPRRKVKRRRVAGEVPKATRLAVEDGVVRVRKHWRRPALLLQAHAWAPPTARTSQIYLATHMMHTKRAHMENIWGYRLAVRNSSLGLRALSRSLARHCCLHDRSYMQLFEVFGPLAQVEDVLRRCGVDRRLLRRDGRRRRVMFGQQLIGPAVVVWSAEAVTERAPPKEELFVVDVLGDAPRDVRMEDAEIPLETGWKAWLWIHPAAALEAAWR